ncbi:MAG: hypothetical protein COB24_12000 [Hyphomicrobiales bacterium]|nr:MAG: hypothetical protein COB24_12000 [Hyphomicrobiales bacterium]
MTISLSPTFTTAGLAAITAAIGNGDTLYVSHIAVGDGDTGSGAEGYAPDRSETALRNELSREAVSGYQLADTQFTVEVLFNTATTISAFEIGYFLNDGTLLAVWSDATALTEIEDGKSLKIRMLFNVGSQEATVVNFVVPVDATLRLDGMNRVIADINWNNKGIKNLADAIAASDAINLGQVVALIDAATPDYTIVEASMTAEAGDVLYVFSDIENIKITLPLNTSDKGDVTIYAMGGHPFKALRNGATIKNKAEDLLFNRKCKAKLVSFDGNWSAVITFLA